MKMLLSAALSLCLIGAVVPAPVRAANDGLDDVKIKHVLLISVDGMHALDVANYVQKHPGSAFAELSEHGVTFSNARTPANSDSFPGLMALVTGGSPVSHGLFYDVSYDRSIFAPGSDCSGKPGNMMVFDESIDKYTTVGGMQVSTNELDPTQLPKYIDENGKCSFLYPHKAIRTNTIFEVVKKNGGRTAWADKHPAYEWTMGPSGHGVDDLYTPEITNVGGLDNTVSVVCTANNDWLKVQAILNQIQGNSSLGKKGVGVPAVFGMNFQAVSVGQKLAVDNKDGSCAADVNIPNITGMPGGYLDGAGTPTSVLDYSLKSVDNALWQMIKGLKNAGIYDSTLFIVSSKHGQSPINPAKVTKPGHFADLVFALDNNNPNGIIINNAGNNCSSGPCGFVQDDDIALIWLPDQTQTPAVAGYLNDNAKALFIDEVLAGNEIKLKFNDPLKDSRTPDILIQPIYGTTYTTSNKKNAEHGGFSFGDTNVGLIVSNPALHHKTVKTPVTTAQVAVTIVKSLGIDPTELGAVRKEGTQPLPFLLDSDDDE
jgi:hypothetical protein